MTKEQYIEHLCDVIKAVHIAKGHIYDFNEKRIEVAKMKGAPLTKDEELDLVEIYIRDIAVEMISATSEEELMVICNDVEFEERKES